VQGRLGAFALAAVLSARARGQCLSRCPGTAPAGARRWSVSSHRLARSAASLVLLGLRQAEGRWRFAEGGGRVGSGVPSAGKKNCGLVVWLAPHQASNKYNQVT
jgi:hypothetical protein